MERLAHRVEATREAPARMIADCLLDESLRYAGGRLADDVAVLVLKRLG